MGSELAIPLRKCGFPKKTREREREKGRKKRRTQRKEKKNISKTKTTNDCLCPERPGLSKIVQKS